MLPVWSSHAVADRAPERPLPRERPVSRQDQRAALGCLLGIAGLVLLVHDVWSRR